MLPTVATVNHRRHRRQAHEHFVLLLWWHQPQRCGFVCLAHRSLWLQRGRCDQTVAYNETVSSPVAPSRHIETMFWRHCGWWNNSAVSGTGISNLARPSSHLLMRWEPWRRRMFRCQNDVKKYVRDVCSWSCSGDKSRVERLVEARNASVLTIVHRHKSTRTVWDFVIYSRLRRQTVNKAADCSCAGTCMDRHTCLCDIMRLQVLAHMWTALLKSRLFRLGLQECKHTWQVP